MERIEFEVNDDTAKKWRYTNPEIRQLMKKEIDGLLKIILEKEKETLWPLLKKIRLEAEQKGFSHSILKQILNEKKFCN